MKKSRAETSGALSGEFADRVRPPYASDEKRRQAAELFAHGIGYQRASRILDLPANTLRDWARAWRAGKLRTTISPHLYRYSDAVKRKAVRMRQKDTPGMRLRKLQASARAPASGGWINSASQQPRAVRMKSDPKRRIKISGNDPQARGWGTQGQGRRAVLPDSIFSFSRMISDPFWGEPCPPKGSSAADFSQMLSLA